MRLPLVCLLTLAPLSFARAQASKNPDRWDTVELVQSGASSLKGEQTSFRKGPNDDQFLRTLNVSANATALFPLSDRWSLSVGGGGAWSETDTRGQGGSNGDNVSDNSVANYTISGRYYFVDRHLRSEDVPNNPDRWPSLAATAAGSDTLNYSAGNAQGNFTQEYALNNVSLTLDTRLPVSDAWTVTAGVAGFRNYSKTNPVANNNGVKSLAETFGASVGLRSFLVGRNLTGNPATENPDRWPMFALSLGGSGSLYGRQTILTSAGSEGQREASSLGYSVSAWTRLPVADHISLRFELDWTYSRSFAPLTTSINPVQNGTLNRTSALNFTAALRYFLY